MVDTGTDKLTSQNRFGRFFLTRFCVFLESLPPCTVRPELTLLCSRPSRSVAASGPSFRVRRGTNTLALMLILMSTFMLMLMLMFMQMLTLMLMLMQATEVASAAKRAQAHETPGRGDMLPRFEVSFGATCFNFARACAGCVRDAIGSRTKCCRATPKYVQVALRCGIEVDAKRAGAGSSSPAYFFSLIVFFYYVPSSFAARIACLF